MPLVAHAAVRTRGTLGGSLAHADPASEWCLLAATLGARMRVRSVRGERMLAEPGFFEGMMATALAPDELLLDTRLPLLDPDTRAGFNEFNRRAGDFAFAMAVVAYRVEQGRIAGPRIAVGGAEAAPRRIAEVEAALAGKAADAAAFRAATSREDLLSQLAHQRGFYVPSFYEPQYGDNGALTGYALTPGREGSLPVRKAAVKTTDALDPPATSIFTPDTEFGARFLVEVVRGCANLCRFCWAGYNYLPVRAFPTDRILQLAEAARAHANRVGLVSIALCDHPDIERILGRLHEMGYSISPASLRLDDLTQPIVQLLQASGERSITIAPETGSDRLRRVINKTVTNDEILDRADLIFANGIENLKLYFMIGLPTESDDDLAAMRDLTIELRNRMVKYAKPRGQIGRIVGSVNPLIPKPGTAYQWLPMEDPAVTDRKIKRLRSLMAGIDNVYFNIKSERHSYYQALLSLGDRRVAPAIDAAERNGQNWRAAVAEAGVDADFFIFRDRSHDACLPWDIIDGGLKANFYRSEFEKALRAEWTLPPKRAQENARLLLPVIQP